MGRRWEPASDLPVAQESIIWGRGEEADRRRMSGSETGAWAVEDEDAWGGGRQERHSSQAHTQTGRQADSICQRQ